MATRKVRDKFPLWLHPSGQWAKKHRGVFHYFGTDRDEALKRFAKEWDDIKAGRKHRPKGDSQKVANESFNLDLSGLSSNGLFTKSRGIGTIVNDD